MPLLKINGVSLAGVASAVPAAKWDSAAAVAAFGAEDLAKITRSTGVKQRHVSTGTLCASDLCYEAADRLINELGWERDSVDFLLFVSQTGDHVLPATSCVLQHRLVLSKDCACFDIGMGCSGYVYGLWTASSLIAASGLKRGLLLVGDTIGRLTSPQDRSTSLLFGDAGSATALIQDGNASSMTFSLGTDGAGWKNLIVPAGGCRIPASVETAQRHKVEGNNERGQQDLYMDGAEIFAFTLAEVPPLIAGLMESSGWTAADVDAFLFHQANKFMLQHLGTKMNVPLDKTPLSLGEYGNTSCASIPLTLTVTRRDALAAGSLRLVMAGFGVGYSWAGCSLTTGPLICPELILVDEKR
ncbi:MAG: ketoacyl-ACP synthase III [Verrucomicrobiaceae bacterium]|nr:ketoacyl-ACP synthase III [Verrucomicrobiaceae bacterium]